MKVQYILSFFCFSILLPLPLIPFPSLTSAATYYVDCTAPNDHGTGISPPTAWKTIAKVNSSSFSTDDQILFKKGCTWREQLTVPSSGISGHPVFFGAYGTGAYPTIKGSDVVTGWAAISAGKYSVSLRNNPNTLYFDGVRGEAQTSDAHLMADRDFYYDTLDRRLYIYSFSDPSGRLIEATNRAYAINTNGNSHITIKNFSLQHTKHWGAGIFVNSGQYITVDSCDLSNNFYAGFLGGGDNATHGYMTVSNCTISNNGGPGITSYFSHAGNIDSGNNLYTLNTIRDNGWRDIECSGINSGASNVEASYNIVYNNGKGGISHRSKNHGLYLGGGRKSLNNIMHHNTVYGQQNGCGLKLLGSGSIYNNLSYHNNFAGIRIGQNGPNNVTVNVYYNIVYGNQYGFQELLGGPGTIALSVYNNTFYNNTKNAFEIWSYDFQLFDANIKLTFKNNIMGGQSDYHHKEFAAPGLQGAVIDNNLYEFGNVYYNKKDCNQGIWRGYGFDAHGRQGSPNFINAAGNNFHLRPTSPAKNAGTNVGLKQDFEGNPLNNPPNIGAYDNQDLGLNAPAGSKILYPTEK